MGEGYLIRDMPYAERPRERLFEKGPDALKNSELIAILLRTGVKGCSALEVAEKVLKRFDSLDNLSRASVGELQRIKGVGRDKAAALQSAFTLARRMAKEIAQASPTLDTPDRVADLLREQNRPLEVETFQVLLLNTRRKLLRMETISQGTLDTLLVHPREVFKLAIGTNAAALILVHNHPSGDPTPSEADIRVTRDLIRAGQVLKIEVLDHIILGRPTSDRTRDYASLRELGYFYS